MAASASDDRLYAYEAAGQLLGMEDLPAEEQQEGLAGLLRPLLAQMQAQLAAAGKAAPGAFTPNPELLENLPLTTLPTPRTVPKR